MTTAARGFFAKEADLVALWVRGDVLEGIAPDDLGELVTRPDDDADLEAEAVADQSLAVASEATARRVRRERDVSALEVGSYILVAGIGQSLA